MSGTQIELENPPTEIISRVAFAPNSPNRLLVSSWDRNVYLYDTSSGAGATGRLVTKIPHRGPVLDVCFGPDDNTAYSAGADHDVNRLDLTTGETSVLSTHDQAVKSVAYSAKHSLLVSASWDSTMHVHLLDARGAVTHPPSTIPLLAKAYALSLSASKLVVAMSSRQIALYDLPALKLLTSNSAPGDENAGTSTLDVEPWQVRESSLKFQTRTVSCMPSDQGYAASSIEGRVGVEWFDAAEESQARKYAFKCHRKTEGEVDVVYPVNALAYHPVHQGTFASGGGDGFVVLWDGNTKRRIRQYQQYPASVASLAWSCDGRFLAVAVSPGFEDANVDTDMTGANYVFVRELGENEAKGKGVK